MIQIRNVPDQLHGTLKARAALSGTSLSEYLLAELVRMAGRPTVQELVDRLSKRTPVKTSLSPARAVRLERDAR